MRASDLDPTGEHHGGLPTYPWRWAPTDDLMTRRQLRAVGLRPGGQEPAAQVVCRGGLRFGYLYRRSLALPVRPMTAARWRSHQRMMLARRTCPLCRAVGESCIPTSLGCCLECADGLALAELEQLLALARAVPA
ncbi:RRQRL motif-containing zinc-binding protein [Kitasatospora sp. MBT66]|uniref:RRQRL motif-containing zinc-binding protein n=1 Tax=Kitasatospora sp. MBT66 TaxID=1444769 RepID=UPI00069143BB|nr:RRQRL motif-containing zinc-binding protein [Kitasatospora sp. MBT66]